MSPGRVLGVASLSRKPRELVLTGTLRPRSKICATSMNGRVRQPRVRSRAYIPRSGRMAT